jgi:hypothetical protein
MEIFIGVDYGKYQIMQHFYQSVQGFMSHRNTIMLDLVLEKFPAGGTWVELGSWMGRSAAYCVVELINREKLGPFYCIDTWDGGIEHQGWKELDTLEQDFQRNIEPVRDHVTVIRSESWRPAETFADATVDFCYVDAGHTYDAVMKDLQAWWPKIRPGSYFGGDDYTKGWPEVCQAVEDFFRDQDVRVRKSGRCWIVTKPEDIA